MQGSNLTRKWKSATRAMKSSCAILTGHAWVIIQYTKNHGRTDPRLAGERCGFAELTNTPLAKADASLKRVGDIVPDSRIMVTARTRRNRSTIGAYISIGGAAFVRSNNNKSNQIY